MFQIRRGVFETNSSSTHSITMCLDSEFERWKNGEVLFLKSHYLPDEKVAEFGLEGKTFISVEELKNILKSFPVPDFYLELYDNYSDVSIDAIDDMGKLCEVASDYDIYVERYDHFFSDRGDDYNTYEHSYTTPKGEKVVAFGTYRYC